MNLELWLVFILMFCTSFVPITRLKVFDISEKYKDFKFVSIFLFVWSLIYFVRYITTSPRLAYFLTLAIYPLIYLLTSLLFLAFMNYLGKKVSKTVKTLFFIGLLLEIVISFTNPLHLMMINIPFDANLNLDMFFKIDHGPIFYIHTLICYTLLFIVMILILRKLYKNIRIDRDMMPFVIMVLGTLSGIIFNAIHVFWHAFKIDPTYIAFVVLISLLYFVIYIRDIKIILVLGKNNFILENLREMYVICNHHGIVEDASEEFKKSFNVTITEKLTFNELMINVSKNAVVYLSPKTIEGQYISGMRYLHMQEKSVDLPFFRYKGKFYLFYDETSNRQYINDINYVKSHDLMTGLYNRNYFEEIRGKIDNSNDFFTVIMFDLDCLKLYNDFLGHSKGDDLLKRFSNKLIEVTEIYKNMIPIRMGGDEFLFIAINKDSKTIDKIIQDINQLSNEETTEMIIVFSYGIASKSSDLIKLESVIKEADKALYQMKANQVDRKEKLKSIIINYKKK